jgi:alpha-glucosidase
MGYNTPYLAPLLSGESGNWTIQVQLPAKTNVSYTYPRYTYQGDYVLDPQNRSIKTGACGSFQVVNDHLDSSIPTAVIPANITDPMATNFSSQQSAESQQHSRRGTPGSDKPGSEQGLPGRNLLTAPYNIQPYDTVLSSQTIPTNLYHANGLAEYDVHNLFGSMMGGHSRTAMLSRRPGKRPLM